MTFMLLKSVSKILISMLNAQIKQKLFQLVLPFGVFFNSTARRDLNHCTDVVAGGERRFIFLPRTNFSMQCGTGLMTVMLMMLTLPPAPASVQ